MSHRIFKLTSTQKALKFQKYKQLRDYVSNILDKDANGITRYNIQKAASNVWSAIHSLPTVLTEPYFELIFDQSYPEESTEVIQLQAEKARDLAVDTLRSKMKSNSKPFVSTFITFGSLDRILKLENKHFHTVSVEEAALALPKNTSSAFPQFEKKSVVYEQNINDANADLAMRNFNWISYPAVVRWRTQQRKSGRKFRQFYMFGYKILTFEMMFAKPFFDHFESNKDTSYCFANVFTDLSPKIRQIKRFNYILSIDYSSFDQQCTAYLIDYAFRYIKSHLILNNQTKRLLFDKITDYALYCSIATKHEHDPIIFMKERGVMSGSVFTNLLDSIINAMMIIEFLLLTNQPIKRERILIMGDDCLVATNDFISIENISEFMRIKFEAIVSVEKSFTYTKGVDLIYFLGYDMNENCRLLDWDLTKRQLIFSESFIPESILPTNTRLFSKLASICFKCSDGYKFWDKYAPKLSEALSVPIPSTFVEIYSITGEPIDLEQHKSIDDFKYNGWLIQ